MDGRILNIIASSTAATTSVSRSNDTVFTVFLGIIFGLFILLFFFGRRSGKNAAAKAFRTEASRLQSRIAELENSVKILEQNTYDLKSLLAERSKDLEDKEKEIEKVQFLLSKVSHEMEELRQSKSLQKEPEQEVANEGSDPVPTESSIAKSLPDCVVFDLETSGINKNTCSILEIGAIKIRGGQAIDTFSSLIKTSAKIDPEASVVNGITSDMLISAPSLSSVLKSFLAFIENDILVGYNIATFDLPILKRVVFAELHQELDNSYIDILPMARTANLDTANLKLPTIAEHFGINTEGAHRAAYDCEMTFQCFLELYNITPYKVKSCSDIYTASIDKHDELTKTQPDIHSQLNAEIHRKHDLTDIEGKSICLTGEFNSTTRSNLEKDLANHGALIKSTVSGKTDYLVVGSSSSAAWKYGNLGTKIVKALELIEKGKSIQIIGEEEFCLFWEQYK